MLRHAATLIIMLGLLLLQASLSAAVARDSSGKGTVAGCVEITGQLSYRGVASLWPAVEGKGPDPRRAIRPPLVSAPLGIDGCFTLQVAPGDYFVGAVVRETPGGWQGPPRFGDRIFLSPDASGKSFKVTIGAGATSDIGRHGSNWTYAGFTSEETRLTITGTLTGIDGSPIQGLLVFAFADSAMANDPVAVSEPTGSDGRYLLRFFEPATIYLRAREHYGRRSPMEGGYLGVYGGDQPTPVTVSFESGNLDHNFTVLQIPPMDVRRNGRLDLHPSRRSHE